MRFIAYTIIITVAIIISFPVVAMLLLTPWDGRSTIFGNKQWGRGNDHFAHPTKGYWQEWKWLCYRNPVNNLGELLAAPWSVNIPEGNTNIIDQREQGSYRIKMGKYWEYGLVWFWSNTRCLRIRLGWKILGNRDGTCNYVFSIVPFKHRPS